MLTLELQRTALGEPHTVTMELQRFTLELRVTLELQRVTLKLRSISL
jgi:hypothetical protein